MISAARQGDDDFTIWLSSSTNEFVDIGQESKPSSALTKPQDARTGAINESQRTCLLKSSSRVDLNPTLNPAPQLHHATNTLSAAHPSTTSADGLPISSP